MKIDTGSTFTVSPLDHIQIFKDQGATVEDIGKFSRMSANGVYEVDSYLVDGLHLGDLPIGQLQTFASQEGGGSTLG
ncbi:hypothetical protein, partial [Salmonella enterica]